MSLSSDLPIVQGRPQSVAPGELRRSLCSESQLACPRLWSRADLSTVSLASNCYPLECRTDEFDPPDFDKLHPLLEKRALARLATITVTELIDVARRPAESHEECRRNMDVAGVLSGFHAPTHMYQALADSAVPPRALAFTRSMRHQLLKLCGEAPEISLHTLATWLADNHFRPVGIPVPDDSDRLIRQTAFSGTSSMNIHHAVARACVKRGEVILVPEASFASFFSVGLRAHADTYVVPTAHTDFRLTAAQLGETIKNLGSHERPRLLLLTNPCNPSGYSYTAKEIRDIATICIRSGITLLVDELYSGFNIPSQAKTDVHAASLTVDIAGTPHRLYDHIVTAWGNSKRYDIIQGRIGVALSGNEDLIARINLHLQKDDAAASVFDAATSEALMKAYHPHLKLMPARLDSSWAEFKGAFLRTRHALGQGTLRLMSTPDSGYYAAVGVSREAARKVGVESHLHFAEYLSKAVGVRTESIEAMQVSREDGLFCRMNFVAVRPGDVDTAFDRIRDWGEKLRDGKAPRVRLEL